MELFYPQEEKTNETNQKEPVLPDNIKQRNNLPEAEKGDLILKPKPRQNSKEVLTSIETPLYKLLLSSVGGGTVKRFYIKEYLNNDSLPVNIINQNLGVQNLSLNLKDLDGEKINLSTSWVPSDKNQFIESLPKLSFLFCK